MPDRCTDPTCAEHWPSADEDDYADLVAGAWVTHPKYGKGVIADEPWLDGQPLVKFAGGCIRTYCNPARLSTDE